MIGLLLSLLDRRFRYPSGSGRHSVYGCAFRIDGSVITPDADGDWYIAEFFGSTFLLIFRTRTVISLLLGPSG